MAASIALNLYMALPLMVTVMSRGYSDYSGLYLAGRIVTDHQSRYLYNYGAQLAFKKQLFGDPHPGIPFNHAAYEALLFAPLSRLPFASSLYVWSLVNVLLLLAMAKVLRPFLTSSIRRLDLVLLCLSLAFAPVGVTLMQGQDSILDLLLFALVFAAFKRGRELWAGVFLALTLFKWPFVMPFVPLLLVQREWKALRGFLAAAAGLISLSLAITGIAAVKDYIALVRMEANIDNAPVMANVRGLLTMFHLGPETTKVLALVIGAGLFLVPLLMAFRMKLDGQRGTAFDLIFALTMTVAVAGGYHVFMHDLSLLLLPLFVVANYLFERRRWKTLAALSFFFTIQIYIYFFGGQNISLLAVPVLALAAGIAIEIRKITPVTSPDAKQQLAPPAAV